MFGVKVRSYIDSSSPKVLRTIVAGDGSDMALSTDGAGGLVEVRFAVALKLLLFLLRSYWSC